MATSIHTTHTGQHQAITWGSAISAGLVGIIVATIVLAIAEAAHVVHMNLPKMYGAMVTAHGANANPYYAGAVIDLVLGVIMGIIYAAIYAATNILPTWKSGLAFGFVNWIIAGLLMAVVPAMPSWSLTAPGMFAANYGTAAIVTLLVFYLIFGAVFGAMYHPKIVDISTTTTTTAL